MKKITAFLLVAVLILGLAGSAFARDDEETKKIEAYLKTLQKKIDQAEIAKDWTKVKQLKKLIAKQKGRLAALKKETAAGTTPSLPKKPAAKAGVPEPAAGGVILEGGYSGGFGMIGVGYVYPLQSEVTVRGTLDYGLGQSVSAIGARAAGLYKINPQYYAGAGLDLVSSSTGASNVLGVGNLSSGTTIGFGLFGGTMVNVMDKKIQVELGYSTVLGVAVMVGYRI